MLFVSCFVIMSEGMFYFDLGPLLVCLVDEVVEMVE